MTDIYGDVTIPECKICGRESVKTIRCEQIVIDICAECDARIYQNGNRFPVSNLMETDVRLTVIERWMYGNS